jgi:hypothetical protein
VTTDTDCGVLTISAAVFVADSVFVATIPFSGAVGSSPLPAVTTIVSSAASAARQTEMPPRPRPRKLLSYYI